MVIHDHVVLFPSVEVEGYPFDPSRTESGGWRVWRTGDLYPSSDHYAIRPFDGDAAPLALFRRSPPVIDWTTRYEGVFDEIRDIADSAESWRHVRFSGLLGLDEISEDNRRYHLKASFNSGLLSDIWVADCDANVPAEIPEQYRDVEITVRDSTVNS